MRVRVMTVTLKTECVAEAAAEWPRYAENFRGKGLRSLQFAADPATGRAVSITTWDDRAAIDRAENRPELKAQFQAFERFYADTPRWDYYDLLATLA
ncbi:MAG: hypothetical protein KDC48_21440 [Planctomycetes bacterium]|nr:hypothetical protein [Planctomycetota bacterium]